jgi:photosystem II stability/assembly factor-like uncharacterized protein
MPKVKLFVGTKKGGIIFTSDKNRLEWDTSKLNFKAWKVMNMVMDPRDQRIHAAVTHPVFGPSTQYSDDLGETWTQAEVSPTFEQESKAERPLGTPEEALDPATAARKPEEVLSIWKIQPAGNQEPDTLYAGVEPAALFKSTDRGQTWEINPGLFNHPHRPIWFPGAGGLCLHTIVPHPADPSRMWVAISTGGCYYTDDGGYTWFPRNKNVRADFLPDNLPEFGQCVHKIVMHPDHPEQLYQQNHCGIYRSDDGGLNWIDIGDTKLPSRFGFPIAVHPHNSGTIYVIPEESDQFRISLEYKFVIWRSKDRGESWEPLTKGLPDPAYLVVLRDAMTTDTCDPAGIYVGTSTGQIFYSRDDGDTWSVLADYLPPIYSLEAAAIE